MHGRRVKRKIIFYLSTALITRHIPLTGFTSRISLGKYVHVEFKSNLSCSAGGIQPAVLQEVSIPVWSNSECKLKYGIAAPGGIVDSFLCAGQAAKDSCSVRIHTRLLTRIHVSRIKNDNNDV